jgi:flagellar biosynthesis/type III secretory pathway M-ring protein FliF/YscJ
LEAKFNIPIILIVCLFGICLLVFLAIKLYSKNRKRNQHLREPNLAHMKSQLEPLNQSGSHNANDKADEGINQNNEDSHNHNALSRTISNDFETQPSVVVKKFTYLWTKMNKQRKQRNAQE